MRHTTARCHCLRQQTCSSWIKAPKASQRFTCPSLVTLLQVLRHPSSRAEVLHPLCFMYFHPQSCYIWIGTFAFRVVCHVLIIVLWVLKSGSEDQISPQCISKCGVWLQTHHKKHLIHGVEELTNLNSGVLRGCDHDREDRMEYHACHRSTVPTQSISFWRSRDPLLGVPFLAHRTSVCHFLFRFVQLWLQLHNLRQGRRKAVVLNHW